MLQEEEELEMQLWEMCMWCLAVAQKKQLSKCVACHVICHIQLTASRCCDKSPVWRGKKAHQNNKKIPQHKLFYVVGNLLLPPVHQDSCEAANSWIITEARSILLKLHLLQKEINSLTLLHAHIKKSWAAPASMAQWHRHAHRQLPGEQARIWSP